MLNVVFKAKNPACGFSVGGILILWGETIFPLFADM